MIDPSGCLYPPLDRAATRMWRAGEEVVLWADSLRKSHDGQRILFDDLTFTVRFVMQPLTCSQSRPVWMAPLFQQPGQAPCHHGTKAVVTWIRTQDSEVLPSEGVAGRNRGRRRLREVICERVGD